MIIKMIFQDGTEKKLNGVKNYDYYPETNLLFAETVDASYYIPVSDKAVIEVYGGAERGYLEGHDEAG